MFWWALSLPAQGASLLFSRTFFSLQRPWITTALAVANLVVNALVLAAPLQAASGSRASCSARWPARSAMAVSQGFLLRAPLHGIEGRRTL